MATAKQLHLLATRPSAYARFVTTGRLPRGVRPQSPLIDLLRALAPRDRLSIRGVVVDARLGYQGRRQFHDAQQALNWLAPSDEVFGFFPAESWRIKQFQRALTLDDLVANCSGAPAHLLLKYPLLQNKSQR